jgi:hypothetical protein
MTIPRPAVLAVLLSGYCLAADVAAQAQQTTGRIDVTHCYVADVSVIESASAYRVQSLQFRGITRANESNSAFNNSATRCVGTLASLGGALLEGRGYCEWAETGEDRLLIRWTVEAGRGSGALVGGTGRYKGISGEIAFQPIAPIPALELGVLRVCNRNTGEFRLP